MKNFYLLYAEDKELINKEIDSLIKKLSISSDSVIKYDITDVNDIVNEAETIGMFSPIKIIIIDSTNYFTKEKSNFDIKVLEDYFDNYNKDSYLVFTFNNSSVDTRKRLYKLISSKGIVKKVDINDNELNGYVRNYVEDYKIDNSTISYFLTKSGTNISNIDSELDKLMLYKMNDKVITKEDIDLLVIENSEEPIYDLVSSILKDNIKKAMRLYEKFTLDGMDVNQMIPIIANQFRLLFQVKRLYNQGKTNQQIADILEFKNVYRVKYLLSDSYYYSEDDLKKYLVKLSDIDRDIKMGRNSGDIALQMFIMKKDM